MRQLRTETEIMQNWGGDLAKPLVSICCITYNHEPYIEDALEGFLFQETDFPFEIIIHDDASTDRTAEIIREYETKYPNLIKPVYQKENQYSKVGFWFFWALFNACSGDYIALCEGDDYWTDAEKLKVQISFMKDNPQCSMCFHPAQQILDSIENPQFVRNKRGSEGFLDVDEIIAGTGGYYPTAATVFRRRTVLAKFKRIGRVNVAGDYLLSIAFLAAGSIGYIDKVMSIYRRNSSSVTQAYKKLPMAERAAYKRKICDNTLSAIDCFDKFLEWKYHEHFSRLKHDHLYGSAKSHIAILDVKESFALYKRYSHNFSYIRKLNLYIRYMLKLSGIKWKI